MSDRSKRVRETLEKARVASGLIGKSHAIDGDWRIGLFYDRWAETKSFVVELSFKDRSRRVALGKEDVETRGKSQWMANNTWRLTPSAVDRLHANIVETIDRSEAKMRGEKA